MHKQKKILFAPLDWGLGHASRCIPLIQYCIDEGHLVIIAGTNATNTLLQKEFPDLKYCALLGYNIKYAPKKWQLPLSILAQLPKIYKAINHENNRLNELVFEHNIDIVFSDNRFGFYSTKATCYFITHQLKIQIPQSSIVQAIANKINRYYIRKYKACLLPDYDNENMAGDLSRCSLDGVRFLGNLSRFNSVAAVAKQYELLILLSGPEPQRSLFEDLLLRQLNDDFKSVLIVRGLPLSNELPQSKGNISYVNHLPAGKLQEAILNAEIIICRSGYSTIMDLIKLNKNAILVPTPGQTEQEYLAKYLMNQKWFTSYQQGQASLKKMIEGYHQFQFKVFPNWDLYQYKKVMKEILSADS